MNDDETASFLAQALGEALKNLTTALAPIVESTEEYRQRLEGLGYPDTEARRMATDYHAALLRMVGR